VKHRASPTAGPGTTNGDPRAPSALSFALSTCCVLSANAAERPFGKPPLSLSWPPAPFHRILDILVRDGMVERDPVERSYRIGPELFRISARVVERYDIRTLALPFMHEIVKSCNEACFLGLYLPVSRKMIFAEKVESSQLLQYQFPMNTPLSVLWGRTELRSLHTCRRMRSI